MNISSPQVSTLKRALEELTSYEDGLLLQRTLTKQLQILLHKRCEEALNNDGYVLLPAGYSLTTSAKSLTFRLPILITGKEQELHPNIQVEYQYLRRDLLNELKELWVHRGTFLDDQGMMAYIDVTLYYLPQEVPTTGTYRAIVNQVGVMHLYFPLQEPSSDEFFLICQAPY